MSKRYSLQKFIEDFKSDGEIIEISEFVNPELEITEFADRMSKIPGGGKALLFTNTGTKFPVLINHYGSDYRILKALGIKSFYEPALRIDNLFKKFMNVEGGIFQKLSILGELKKLSEWFPKKSSGRGICQEVIINNPDLNALPILKCWPYDGGKFITLPLVITRDPENGMPNIGMYRMQVFDRNTTGMHWHLHKGGAAHFEKYKKSGKLMPVSVVLGGDPVLTYCATAPMPENLDEFILAGFLRNNPVKLVKCITNDLYVPDNADFVIEGYIDPTEEFRIEGPFGDHTGFYSLADKYPVFHVTCITHRNDAIYPATVVGVPPMEDYYLGKATEKIFLKPIQLSIVPELVDMRLPAYGVAHNLVLLKAETRYRGQSLKIMNSLLGAGQMMFTKVMCCFDPDVDIQNDTEILTYFANLKDIKQRVFITAGPADVLEHASYSFSYGGKILLDFTGMGIEIDSQFESLFLKTNDKLYSYGKLAMIKGKNNSLSLKDSYLLHKSELQEFSIIIVCDNLDFDFNDPFLLFWYILNNFDPAYDCLIFDEKLLIDCRRKNFNRDGFSREWPNVVCMSDSIIEKIDKLWCQYTALEFISSPSNKVKFLVPNEGAVLNND